MDLLCESGRRRSGRITTTFEVLRVLEEESSEWDSADYCVRARVRVFFSRGVVLQQRMRVTI